MRFYNREWKFDRLKTLWKKYPDLRLGQLILNVLQDPALYYIEDAELIDLLDKLSERNYYEFTNK